MNLNSIPPNRSGPRSPVALGSLIQTVARVVTMLLGLVLMGYLTRRLGTEEYGLYAVAVVMVNWVVFSIGTATGGATVRLVAGHENGPRYAVAILQVVTMAGVAGVLIVFFGAHLVADWLRSPGLGLLLQILSLQLLLATVGGIYHAIVVAQGRFLLTAIMQVGGVATQLLTAWLLVERGWWAAGACMAMVSASLLDVVVGRTFSGISIFSRARADYRDLWRHIRMLAGGQLALRAIQTMDLFAVKLFSASPVGVGLYAGGQNISLAAMMLFGSSSSVVLQSLASSRREGRPDEVRRTADLYLRAALAYMALLASFSVLADEIVVFLLGNNFRESGTVLAILLWAVAFRVIAVTGRVFIAAKAEKAVFVIPLLVLTVLGFAAYALAIPRGGIEAAAAVALGMAALAGFVSLRTGMAVLDLRFPWISLIKIIAAALCATTVASVLPANGWLLLLNLCATTLAYAAALFLLREWRFAAPLWRLLR